MGKGAIGSAGNALGVNSSAASIEPKNGSWH